MPDPLLHSATIPSVVLAVAAALVAAAFLLRVGSRSLRRVLADYGRLRALTVSVFAVVSVLNALAAAVQPPAPATAAIWALSLLAPVLLFLLSLALRIRAARRGSLPRTVLAVGAHPDDVELAAGGTIARLVDQGHRVHILVMSGGAVGGDIATRPAEARAAAAFLGAVSSTVHDFPDARLASVELDVARAIEHAIAELEPDIILTHSAHDQHQDHVAVHRSVMRAARRHTSILCFESPSATRAFDPSVFVDIERYLDIKATAVAIHRDQGRKPYMTAGTVRGVAAFRGQQARRAAAEGFEPMRLSLDLQEVTG